MVSHEYWLKRAALQDKMMRTREDEVLRRISDQLTVLESDIIKEIQAFYARYAANNGMTQAEAAKFLTSEELDVLNRVTLAEYRQLSLNQDTPEALLDALSIRHRVSRKEALLEEIRRRTGKAYLGEGGITDQAKRGMADGYISAAAQTGRDLAKAGVLSIKGVVKLNDELIARRMASEWSGTEFSKRIWTHGEEHFKAIKETMDKALTGGWGLDKTVKEVAKRTEVSQHNAERLVRTEMTAYNTLANYDMYKALGAKTYKIEAILDSRTSAICRSQNNRVYSMDDFAPGKTAPPFHVRCRSKIIPTTEQEQLDYYSSQGEVLPEPQGDNGATTDPGNTDPGKSGKNKEYTLDEVLQMYHDKEQQLRAKYGLSRR